MTITVRGPDGSSFNFPDSTPENVISGALSAHYGAPKDDFKSEMAANAPPGEIVHGAGGAQSVTGSNLTAQLPSGGNERDNAVTLEALRQRSQGRDLSAPGRALAPVMQGLSFGLGDEAVAGATAAIRPGNPADEYRVAKEIQKQELERQRSEHPYGSAASEIGGGLMSGLGAFKAGATASRYVPQALQGARKFGANLLASAADGAGYGALTGFGSGDGAADSALKGIEGAGFGGAVGAGLPVVGKAVGLAASPVINPIRASLAPESMAGAKWLQTFRRAGMEPEQVALALEQAHNDGQGGVFTAADALGHAGQRSLSAVTRIPHNERQAVVDFLDRRQAGQGRRISNALSEGFAAPDTAAQREATLTAKRKAAADRNYGQARSDAGAVDVSPAIAKADEFLSPSGVTFRPGSGIADDSVESAVRRARGYLTDGKSQVSDFSTALRSKRELDNLIDRASPSQQHLLVPIRDALDDQLAATSKSYANARDTFRRNSQAIEAVQTGRDAAVRGRYEDTIPAFQAMRPDQQSAFRAGYSDPLIAGTREAVGVNKARPLINDSTDAEFPAFAAPGAGPQLGRRLARENTMFETAFQAKGGSGTAQNLADSGDLHHIDPAILGNLLTGNFKQAAKNAGHTVLARAAGLSPGVAERLSRMLLETEGSNVLRHADTARRSISANDARSQALARLLLGGAAGAGAATQ
jgi:hypothetical protein